MKSYKTVYLNGIEYYNEQGKRHRTDGPAVEYNNGTKYWYINGKFHREDGPAIEWHDGSKTWWINGIEYSEQEWEQEVAELKLKRILDL
jgi:hypothetical protein